MTGCHCSSSPHFLFVVCGICHMMSFVVFSTHQSRPTSCPVHPTISSSACQPLQAFTVKGNCNHNNNELENGEGGGVGGGGGGEEITSLGQSHSLRCACAHVCVFVCVCVRVYVRSSILFSLERNPPFSLLFTPYLPIPLLWFLTLRRGPSPVLPSQAATLPYQWNTVLESHVV